MDRTKMYGVTHDDSGAPIIRVPRSTKVGIGMPKGPDIMVWINMQGKWIVAIGGEQQMFETKEQAKDFYKKSQPKAPHRKFPRSLSFFTFTQIQSDGVFHPDWEAIEAHGVLPTEADIMFLDNEPFEASYQMWKASGLLCEGDGINARRVLEMAKTEQEKQLAQQAAAENGRFFPIKNGCAQRGCPYREEQNGKPALCRPHGRLQFQLGQSIRLGSTAYFDTTGHRSIQQIFSCLETFRKHTNQGGKTEGFVAGIPLRLVVRPYRVTYQGRSATQFAIRIEFHADSAEVMKRNLLEFGYKFKLAAGEQVPEVPMLPAAQAEAHALSSEFYPGSGETFDEEQAALSPATEETDAQMKARLSKSKPPVPASEPEAAPPPPPAQTEKATTKGKEVPKADKSKKPNTQRVATLSKKLGVTIGDIAAFLGDALKKAKSGQPYIEVAITALEDVSARFDKDVIASLVKNRDADHGSITEAFEHLLRAGLGRF